MNRQEKSTMTADKDEQRGRITMAAALVKDLA